MPSKPRRCTVVNGRTQTPICAEVRIARTFFTRLVGLLAHRELPPNRGLWLQPSTGIHTLGMRFNIDVLGLDRDGAVVKIVEDLKPWRIVGMPRKTRSVIELPAGHLRQHPVQLGDQACPGFTM